jgi:endoglucanase
MLLRSTTACSLLPLLVFLACDEPVTNEPLVPDAGYTGPTNPAANPILATSDVPPGEVSMTPPTAADANAFDQAKLITRGMNIGNYLDQPGAPSKADQPQCPASPPIEGQGAGGGKVRAWMFEAAKLAGFDHIRLTVNWNCHTHATDTNPYAIDEAWLARVDWAVAHALTRNLAIIVDMHNYWDYFNLRPGERDKFMSMWTQLAEHYKDYPKQLFFELLNEPPYGFSDATLGADLRDAISAIRVSNPYRSIIYGGTDYNKTNNLALLTQLPTDDKNLIATIHYYAPYCFTHPGQTWDCHYPSNHDASNTTVQWPVLFPGDYVGEEAAQAAAAASQKKVADDFDAAAAMSQQIGRPIYNGEFGASMTRDMASRAAYIAAVARASEERNIGWANWGIVNCQFDAWNSNVDWYPQIIQALLPQ